MKISNMDHHLHLRDSTLSHILTDNVSGHPYFFTIKNH